MVCKGWRPGNGGTENRNSEKYEGKVNADREMEGMKKTEEKERKLGMKRMRMKEK